MSCLSSAANSAASSDDTFVVQRLVLEALCPTWPPFGDELLATHVPASSKEYFMAMLTKSMSRANSSAGSLAEEQEPPLQFDCSRIGVSVLLLARWTLCVGVTAKAPQWHVQAPNPLTGDTSIFRVLECIPPLPQPSLPRGSPHHHTRSGGGGSMLDGALLRFAAAVSSCVSFYPLDLDLLHDSNCNTPLDDVVPRIFGQEEPWLRRVATEVQHSLHFLATGATPSDAAHNRDGSSCGVLVHGMSGVGKTHQLKMLVDRLPRTVTVGGSSGDAGVHLRVCTRFVSVPSLFEQCGQETDAARLLCSMVCPPAVAVPQRPTGGHFFGLTNGSICTKRLTVVVLDNIGAVGAGSEELFVLTAAHALGAALEQQHQEGEKRHHSDGVVVIGVTADSSLLHPILCSSRALMTVVVEAAPPSEALRSKLYMDHMAVTTVPPSWVEATAGWTVSKILLELQMLAPAQPTDGPLPPPAAQASPLSSIIGVQDVVDTIQRLLLFPFRHRLELSRCGVQCPQGALIVGPSGSGKTALLAALQHELRHDGRSGDSPTARHPQKALNVMMVDALSLLHKEVGRSEKNIQALLAEARASAPSVVFLDNLDAIAPPRGSSVRETNVTADRTLSTLLVELDGVRDHHDAQVLVIASAPSVASLDAAMVRPGRLDLHLELHLPSPEVLAELIVRRLFDDGKRLLTIEESCAQAELQRLLEGVITASAASAGRPLTFADGIAAVRAVVLQLLGALPSPSQRPVAVAELVDIVRGTLSQA